VCRRLRNIWPGMGSQYGCDEKLKGIYL